MTSGAEYPRPVTIREGIIVALAGLLFIVAPVVVLVWGASVRG